MKNAALIGAAGLVAYAAWELSKDGGGVLGEAAEAIGDAGQGAANLADSLTGGMLKISNMSRVTPAQINNPNVRALLRVIRAGEGTADDAGYRRIFGGSMFQSYADHPRQTIRKSGYVSTAAGAYQMLSSTWDETKRIMNLPDFSPASQDAAAVGRIAARGALEDAIAGRFELALKKIGKEWASMPGSPYGQPVISLQKAKTLYALAGGGMGTMA